MFSLLASISMLLIALCQCFHVFKLYKQLITIEVVLNSLVMQVELNDWIKQQEKKREIKKTSPLYSRTDEQKRVASIKRKEWWIKKRAEDAKNATQPIV